MLVIKPTNRFLKDLKPAKKRGKDIDKLEDIIDQLQAQKPLPSKNRDHGLTGDWLLIYSTDHKYLFLERTGTHSDLFK